MRLDNARATEIVQIPAIVKGNNIEQFHPAMAKLPKETLQQMAEFTGGELIYIKMNAVYTVMPEAKCLEENCYDDAVTEGRWCKKHDGSISKDYSKAVFNELGIVKDTANEGQS